MNLLAIADEAWRLETRWDWAPWVTVLFGAAAVAAVVVCYRREASPAGNAYRAALALLRLTTIALLLLMLSEAVYSGSRTGRPRFAVLVDRSASMLRADAPPEGEGGKRPRLDAATGLLTRDRAALLRRLERGYEVDLALVDAAARSVGAADIGEALAALRSDATAEDADPSATRLGDAIAGLSAATPEAPLQGVLVLTDGQVTAGRSLSDAAEAARRAGAPLYFVGVGDETAPPEARLADLVAEESAFVDDLVPFRASLSTRGLAGKSIRVELLREGQTEPVAAETITPPSDSETATVRLVDRPTTAGDFRYTIRARAATGAEVDSLEESDLRHTLSVRDGRVRVLLAAGYPNYEFRYLKQLLERDETVQLSHHLQESDPEYSEADLTALPRMPIRLEDLAEYDAAVLIDLDPSLLPRSVWGEFGRFVGERGGGLVLVAGPRSLPHAFRSAPEFVALCPTEVGPSALGGYHERAGFAVLPTPLGAENPAMELGDSPPDSDRVWRSLPPLYWRADVGAPKPAAQTFATHPTARLDSGGPAPLIVSQFYGAGRVVLHAFDSTYRWRFRVGEAYFARYWVQTLRSLARGKRSEAAAAIELTASKPAYDPGEPVRLRLRDQRPSASPDATATVVLQGAGRADRRIELSAAGASGRAEGVLRDLPPGRYRALLADAGDEPIAAEFEVVAPLGEDAHPEMNRAALVAAAERSRGAFFTLADADRLADAIPPGRPTPLEALPPIDLWNRWPILAAITAALTAEWVLRKRRAML